VGLPLGTAIPEELAFRGLVLGLLIRKLTPLRAALVTSAIFVAWHVVVQVQTLAVINFTSPWLIVPAMGLAFAGVFAGGVIFALLRLRTRNLAAAVGGSLVVRRRLDYGTVFPDPFLTA